MQVFNLNISFCCYAMHNQIIYILDKFWKIQTVFVNRFKFLQFYGNSESRLGLDKMWFITYHNVILQPLIISTIFLSIILSFVDWNSFHQFKNVDLAINIFIRPCVKLLNAQCLKIVKFLNAIFLAWKLSPIEQLGEYSDRFKHDKIQVFNCDDFQWFYFYGVDRNLVFSCPAKSTKFNLLKKFASTQISSLYKLSHHKMSQKLNLELVRKHKFADQMQKKITFDRTI